MTPLETSSVVSAWPGGMLTLWLALVCLFLCFLIVSFSRRLLTTLIAIPAVPEQPATPILLAADATTAPPEDPRQA
jgi:hypothetical protein